MALWLGIMKVTETAGLMRMIVRAIPPVGSTVMCLNLPQVLPLPLILFKT
jgi:spore maturation protein SpmA